MQFRNFRKTHYLKHVRTAQVTFTFHASQCNKCSLISTVYQKNLEVRQVIKLLCGVSHYSNTFAPKKYQNQISASFGFFVTLKSCQRKQCFFSGSFL